MPKNIQSSVGFGGNNDPASVMTVQYLLNCVPVELGGPHAELAIDGIVGPKTVAAIRHFQNTWFGKADGRVDPGGKTIHSLQPHDPLPDHPFVPTTDVVKIPAPPSPFTTSASYRASYKTPGGGAPGKHTPTSGWGTQPGIGMGSGGGSGAGGIPGKSL